MRDARRQAGNYPLGPRRYFGRALPQGSLATRAVCHGRRPSFLQWRVYAAIDLSLYLVEKFCGHEIALQCAKSLLLSMPRGPAVWIFSRTIVASAFRREDQTKRGIPAATFRPRHFDRHSRQAGRNGPAQFHPPFQGSDRPRAGRLPPDTQSLGRKGNALTRHRVDSGRQLENRLRRYRVLPQSVQASHRHDAR